MLCEVPLTKEQQDFAAANHGLVYKFLNDNCLSEDEFYDVVIFAYLKAVRDYCSHSFDGQYTFSTIALRQMRFGLYDYLRTQSCQKRRAEIISIQLEPYSGSRSLEELLSVQEDNQQYHFSGGRVSVKDWFYHNVSREEKEYLKLEYAAVEEIGKLMRAIPPEVCEQLLFQILYYRYYNFDLEQPFFPQYQRNTRQLLEKLREIQQGR